MNTTPLEDQVHDALHREADPLQRAPFTVVDVRTRARRIQRRRAVAAGAAVAAVLAIAVPVGLSMTGPAQRSEIMPAPSPSAPAVTGTVRIDPRSAEVVESAGVPLVDVDAPSVIAADGTTRLPAPFDRATPYRGGWVGVAMDESSGTLQFLTADLERVGVPRLTGGLVVSPDGRRVAWSEYVDGRWRTGLADPAGDTDPVYTDFGPGTEDQDVTPVGFLSDSEVVAKQNDGAGNLTTYVADGGVPVEKPGLMEVMDASPVTGMLAGTTESDVDGSCSAVVDGRSASDGRLWRTCDYALRSFSPDGSRVVGVAPSGDGQNGSRTLAILDATTGEPIVDFAVAGSPRQFPGIDDRMMAWADDDTLVLRVTTGNQFFIVRVGVDGTVQRVGIAAAGASGISIGEVR